MAIDFTLTPPQRELQLESRRFAVEVLAGARAAELLPTAEERFLATRPVYEAMVVAGFLRKCIPQPAGGENAGLIDTAIMAEELYSVNASVTLTMLGTVLGLLPILLGGTPEQCGRMLAPFLKKSGTPLAGFCSSEPGGSANAASPPPGEGVRTFAKLHGDRWVIKANGVRSDGVAVSMTNAITVLSKDRLRWESSDRTVGDSLVAGTDSFYLVRRAPIPGIGK